jgi:hypothetical protein
MAIPSKQIGWSNESNLLWQIARQLQQLTQVTYASGGGGGNYIPLTGTDLGSPVSGNIEFDFNANLGIYATDGNVVSKFDLNDKPSIIYSDPTDSSDTYLNNQSFQVSSSNSTFKGFSGGQDFSANITNLDYAQKVYVDTKQPQLSGSGFVIASGTTISYDDNSYVESLLNQSPNSTVTGTVSETLLLTYLMSANTIPTSAGLRFSLKYSKPLSNGTVTIRIKVNSVNNFATATTIATYLSAAGTNSGVMIRNPSFQIGNIYIYSATGSVINDESLLAPSESTIPMLTTSNIFFFVSMQQASILDTTFLRTFKITN